MSDAGTEGQAQAAQGQGLLASAGRLLATLLGIIETRVALVANEYEEEREHLRDVVFYSVVALFFLTFGLLLLSLFVILLFWDRFGVAAVGVGAGLYLLLGVLAYVVLRVKHRNRPRLFATTLAELARDRQELGGKE
jgi:uncharacterized membrane protein YqjE